MLPRVCSRSGLIYTGTACDCTPCQQSRARDNLRRAHKASAHGRTTARWRRLSKRRIKLAGGRCELQLPGCTRVATSAHLDPRLQGNHRIATINEVRAACAQCHGRVDGARSRGRGAWSDRLGAAVFPVAGPVRVSDAGERNQVAKVFFV